MLCESTTALKEHLRRCSGGPSHKPSEAEGTSQAPERCSTPDTPRDVSGWFVVRDCRMVKSKLLYSSFDVKAWSIAYYCALLLMVMIRQPGLCCDYGLMKMLCSMLIIQNGWLSKVN